MLVCRAPWLFAVLFEAAGDAFALFDGEDVVDVGEGELFDLAAGPVDFDGVDFGGVGEAEVEAEVVGGEVGAAGEDVVALADAAGGEVDGCADCVFGALFAGLGIDAADEVELDPVVVVVVYVFEQDGDSVHVADDDVDFAPVEDVAKGSAAAYGDDCESGALDGGDFGEFTVFEVVEQLVALGVAGAPLGVLVDLGVDVAVGDEEVFPAVVVIVEEAVGKADEGDGWAGDAGAVTDIGEGAGAIVFEDDFVVVGEGGGDDVEVAVVLVVADGEAHIGDLAAALVDGETGDVGVVFEGAVALVDVEVVGG